MSIDMKMAWRNIRRNPRRTVLTVSAIAFACLLLIFMLSFQFGSYETMINAAVRIQTGHFQVQHGAYAKRHNIRKVVARPGAVAGILGDTHGVTAFTFRAEAFSIVSSEQRTHGAFVIGIDAEREKKISTLKDLVREGKYLSSGDTDQAMLGYLLARNLKVTVGDELTLIGQGRDGSVAAAVVRVKGIYRSGRDAFDRSGIHIPLAFFQETFAMAGAVHRVVGVVDALSHVDGVTRRIQERITAMDPESPLIVRDWSDIMPGLKQAIAMDLISGLIFWLLLIIVVAFSILNTFLMAIFERIREFGIMLAIGTTPARLMRIVLMESMCMTLLGMAIGVVLGILLTFYFQIHGVGMGGAGELMRQYGISGRIYPRLSFLSIAIGPAMVFCITFFTALYPALKVRRLQPVAAMNKEGG